jgi:hypothetical protein
MIIITAKDYICFIPLPNREIKPLAILNGKEIQKQTSRC